MVRYNKILVGIGEDGLKCYASRGDLLYLANSSDKIKGSLPKDHHYFVSLTNSRIPSRFGVVKELKEPITTKDLAILNLKSLGILNESFIETIELEPYERFLAKVNSFPVNTPLATTWLEKGILNKTRELRVHKVFLNGLTNEDKEELLEFDIKVELNYEWSPQVYRVI